MSRRGWLLLAAWIALLALGVMWVQGHLRISGDLRLFMPAPKTEGQRLLVQNIGESPASRLLLVTLEADGTVAAPVAGPIEVGRRLAVAVPGEPGAVRDLRSRGCSGGVLAFRPNMPPFSTSYL